MVANSVHYGDLHLQPGLLSPTGHLQPFKIYSIYNIYSVSKIGGQFRPICKW